MFRLWSKQWKDNHMISDILILDDTDHKRTKKVLDALEKTCMELDLPIPIWLDNNIREFQLHAKTRFRQDNFMETIPFDFLEIQVIEEDDFV